MTDKPLGKRVRFEVLKRDNHTCRYCGATAPDVELTVDHVVPRALGGSNDPANLVTACKPCNDGKASTNPDTKVVDDVAQDAFRWAAAMKKAAEWQADERARLDGILAVFEATWDDWTYDGGDKGRLPIPKPNSWESSVERLVTAGVDRANLLRLVVVAMESQARIDQKWRYFCGCGWRHVDDLQERARTILEDEQAAATMQAEPVTEPSPGDFYRDFDPEYADYLDGENERELHRQRHPDTGQKAERSMADILREAMERG